jgi:hypothetical protein
MGDAGNTTMSIAGTGEGGEDQADQGVLNRSFERLGRAEGDGHRSRERSREREGDEADDAAEKTEIFWRRTPEPESPGEKPASGARVGDGGSLGGSDEGNGGNGGGDQGAEEAEAGEDTMEQGEERLPVSTTVARLNDGVAANVMDEAMLAVTENQAKESILREARAACERLAHEEDRSKVLDDGTRKVAERAQEMMAKRAADRLPARRTEEPPQHFGAEGWESAGDSG